MGRDMEAGRSHDDILQHVVRILRRDLKLGPDAPIPPDMAFSGGDIDLDSLDILLLVTSVEKEFGVKIPSSEVGKEVFTNVATLVDYIHAHADDAASPPPMAPAAPSAPAVDDLARLPHGDAFRFVTRVIAIEQGKSAEAVWSLRGDEPFFAAHFPGNPLVPGVLLTEALAQTSGLAGPPGAAGGVLAHVDIRFDRPVAPPAEITLRSTLVRTMDALQQFDVSATVQGSTVASGSIALHRTGNAR